LVPFFLYIMRGMSFVDETMDYYERHLFKREIRQIPHRGFLRWVANFLYADPIQAGVVEACGWPSNLKIVELEDLLRESEDLSMTALVATGIRADDSPMRMMSLKRHGPITMTKKKWHPIRDWTKAQVIETIEKAGLKLSAEYDWMPRSFSGIHAGYILAIKRYSPSDYRKILEWMPLIEAECWRYERAGLVE
jgi:3'-phosphoadenosine 5'-phosphosulfate sulfotransferase (PAPS reductase)/FAD synthetase